MNAVTDSVDARADDPLDLPIGPDPGTRAARQRPHRRPSPFTDARREWNAVLGPAAAAANTWRLVAILALIIAAVNSIGLVYLGAHRKVVPFVAVVDRWGKQIAAGAGNMTTITDPRVALAQLSQFVRNVRMVTSDGYAQKQAIRDVYTMLSASDPAYQFLTDFYTAGLTDPFERAKQGSVGVDIQAALPVSPNTYRLEWTETTPDRQGKVTRTEEYQASVMTRQESALDEAGVLANPLGIFVHELHWARRL